MTNKPNFSEKLKEKLKEAGTIERFERDYASILTRNNDRTKNELYANCLHNLLELAVNFKPDTEHVLFGGLVVPAYAYSKRPEEVVLWRGTDDIDLIGNERDLRKIFEQAGYRKVNGNSWGNNAGKRDHYVYVNDKRRHQKLHLTEKIEVADYDVTDQIKESAISKAFYGADIRVPSFGDYIALKREAGRKKDAADAKTLKEILVI